MYSLAPKRNVRGRRGIDSPPARSTRVCGRIGGGFADHLWQVREEYRRNRRLFRGHKTCRFCYLCAEGTIGSSVAGRYAQAAGSPTRDRQGPPR